MDTLDIVEAVVSIAAARELIFPNLLWLPNANANLQWNCVKVSMGSEVCSAL